MRALILAAILGLGSFQVPFAQASSYRVAPRVSVAAEDVTLADLVPGAPRGWTQVALGRAPRPGSERVLSGAWVLQRARQVGAEGLLLVPEDVVLVRGGRDIAREDVEEAVERALAGRLGPGEELRVTSVSLPRPVTEGILELQAVVPEGALSSPATVWVDVLVDGERAARAWARVEMFRSSPVLVLAREVRRGDVLSPEDVAVQSGSPGPGALADPLEAVGRRAVRRLPAGAPLAARDLESVPAVKRGDTVRLVARVGGVTATTLGKALETAGVGDTLRVENLSSGRSLAGVLRDGGVVDVAR
ncbi:MAG: flagellar basal body P-ring formation chaperone FlgA [Thermodesulfobacteriota bacterium]